MRPMIKNMLLWLALGTIVITAFNYIKFSPSEKITSMSYSKFMEDAKAGKIKSVVLDGPTMVGVTTDQKKVSAVSPERVELAEILSGQKIDVTSKPREESFILNAFMSLLPIFLLLLGMAWMTKIQRSGGKGGAMFGMGKSKNRLLDPKNNSVTFASVAGCDEAKAEVSELVDFLKDSSKFEKLGGAIPKGVLLSGPPGTGKTLLAKAIAGEAGVPFFSISGSDFVEMFVGVGAARVRELFATAKKQSPCIVFIDEIDAVGRQRGTGVGGGSDEREQTLNQMLVEMDGFEGNTGIIVLAATNRPDVLDPALLRPGRFDRQVVVSLPDIKGREQILLVYLRKIPAASDVTVNTLARGTPGFSGADLANLVNEAALFAARSGKQYVGMDDFEKAKDKIMMGPERKNMVMSEDERRNTAYHEAGHAVVACMMPKADPVHKVTIIPRGRSLGVTFQLPEADRYGYDRDYLLTKLSVLFGGRVAEEIFMNQMTTGASNDFERATQLARDMVMRYGMSDKLGMMVYAESSGEMFLGRSMQTSRNVSEEMMRQVDYEVMGIIKTQSEIARNILEANKAAVELMVQMLLEKETIDSVDIKHVLKSCKPESSSNQTIEVAVMDI
jgi:cell division protease FtsH